MPRGRDVAETAALPPILGIPVRYDPRMARLSDSRGLGPWKRITVGPAWLALTDREKGAILLHEAGHVKLRHLEKRIARLWLLLWRPSRLAEYCRAQEHEADAYAALCGYGLELAMIFSRMHGPDSPLHPGAAERIRRLTTMAGGKPI